jgi:hAT family C-terminal dimerisation region
MLGQLGSHADTIKYMFDNDLQQVLTEIYELYSLIITIPVTSASVERSFSTLKRIKTFLRNTMSQDRLCNDSVISIEKKRVN